MYPEGGAEINGGVFSENKGDRGGVFHAGRETFFKVNHFLSTEKRDSEPDSLIYQPMHRLGPSSVTVIGHVGGPLSWIRNVLSNIPGARALASALISMTYPLTHTSAFSLRVSVIARRSGMLSGLAT